MNLREMDERFDAYCERNLGEEGSGPREGLPPEWRGKRRRRVEREVDFDLETETAVAFAEQLGHPGPSCADVKRVRGGAAALLLRDEWAAELMVVVKGPRVLRWSPGSSAFRELEEEV